KIITFFRRVASGSFLRFFRNLNIVHNESGKNRIWLFFNMVFSMFRYGIGYLDYMTFGFAYIGKDKRKTFMTMDDNLSLARRLNNPEANPTFTDKLNFNRTFKEYLKRDFVDLQSGFESFEKFCQGKVCFFAKEPSSFGGLGVVKVDLSGKNLKELYSELISKKLFLAEEAIVQHDEMNRLCSRSVNTIRIVTLLSDKGNANFVYALIRVGSGKNDVDNVTSGGMYTLLSKEGVITHPMFCDKTVSYYTEHPNNGFEFIGFKVPYFDEALELCKKAAKVEPRMRYVGWDVAITPTGPVLVEGNNLPGYDMCQNHRFHDSGEGMKAAFEFAEKN
ncbi:MAG: sugar-transfer associated ATP-grasp domain-containing protein, partial [Ruminococcus sp.]|nr:sugar-transfer associated ATP-grasp domain-containing protein [Ruminococcus sp.]